MNQNVSRKLDVLVGVPLCLALTLIRRVRQFIRRDGPAHDRPHKILFVKLAEMGAIVLAAPALRTAARRVGRQNIYCLMLDTNRPIQDLLGIFPAENIITIRDDSLWTFATDLVKAMRRCRAEGVDTAIDLEGFTRISAIITFLSGAARRVGFHRYTTEGPNRGDLFTHRVAYNPYQHASVQFLTLVEAADVDPVEVPLVKARVVLDEVRPPLVEPTDDERWQVRNWLRERCGGEPARPLVIFNPNLIDALPLRQWPRRHWVELGRRILREHPDATLLLVGLDGERRQSEHLARDISPERAFSVAGETTLRSLVVLFTEADLLVTSDCGPAHMAALTDIPIVSIFGPETPLLYAPLSPHNRSLTAGLACSPCLGALNHRNSPCRDNVCMREVTVDRAYQALIEQYPALAACLNP